MAGLGSGWVVVEDDEAVEFGGCEEVGYLVLGVGGVDRRESGEGGFDGEDWVVLWW